MKERSREYQKNGWAVVMGGEDVVGAPLLPLRAMLHRFRTFNLD
jgi:hypothetical protein